MKIFNILYRRKYTKNDFVIELRKIRKFEFFDMQIKIINNILAFSINQMGLFISTQYGICEIEFIV